MQSRRDAEATRFQAALQECSDAGFQVFHGSQFVGDGASRKQQLASTAIHAVICPLARHALQPDLRLPKGGLQLLQQGLTQALQLHQSSPSPFLRGLVNQPFSQQQAQAGEQGGGHQLTEGKGAEAAGVQPVLHLAAAVPAGFAPVGEVLAVVEQQVVVLLADAAHGPAQGDSG